MTAHSARKASVANSLPWRDSLISFRRACITGSTGGDPNKLFAPIKVLCEPVVFDTNAENPKHILLEVIAAVVTSHTVLAMDMTVNCAHRLLGTYPLLCWQFTTFSIYRLNLSSVLQFAADSFLRRIYCGNKLGLQHSEGSIV